MLHNLNYKWNSYYLNIIYYHKDILCGLWSLGASVLFLNDGISTGGATCDGLPPRSGTLKQKTNQNIITETNTVESR